MNNTIKTGISNVDVRIGVGVVLALLLAHLIPGDLIQKLAACTAVIMCTQENASFGWRSALTRVEGVVIGGVIAVLVVLLDGLSGNDYVFMLLCGLGTVASLWGCRAVGLPAIAARVGCITFALVTLVMPGQGRIGYALLRLLGTAAGAAVALLVSWVYDRWIAKGRNA